MEPSKPTRIVIIGAGSAIFGLGTLATLVRSPRLRGGTLALVDLNAEGLALIDALARRLNREWDAGLTIESSTAARTGPARRRFCHRLHRGRPPRGPLAARLGDSAPVWRAPALRRKRRPRRPGPHAAPGA